MIFLKVAVIGDLLHRGDLRGDRGRGWRGAAQRGDALRPVPGASSGFAVLLGAIAYAGAGGGQNLCQSNWIRDKGFGMGQLRARGW